MSGLPTWREKYQSSPMRATATMIPMSGPAPCSELNATPVLRTFTNRMPRTTSSLPPRSMLPLTSAFVIWSSAITAIATATMRAQARLPISRG